MGEGALKDMGAQRADMPGSGGSWWAKTHMKEQLKSLNPAVRGGQWLLSVGRQQAGLLSLQEEGARCSLSRATLGGHRHCLAQEGLYS